MPEKSLTELEAMVGTTRTTVESFDVEAGKVEEFARAVYDDNPAHRDPEAASEQGHDRIPAPLTFTRVADFPRHRPDDIEGLRGFDLGFDREYVLHGEQSYEFERPVYVGDTLHGETTLTDVYRREGRRGGDMTFAEFETRYVDENDDLVLTERAVSIETGGVVDDDTED